MGKRMKISPPIPAFVERAAKEALTAEEQARKIQERRELEKLEMANLGCTPAQIDALLRLASTQNVEVYTLLNYLRKHPQGELK